MFYFNKRKDAREFAKKAGRKVTDNGTAAAKRWGVKVL